SIKLEIYRSLYTSVAEEMGVSLRRTSFSPNIKERRDYSCAVFDRRGRLIAQGEEMSVNLGSMPMTVRAAIEQCEMGPGDVVILNDPYAGGTHLPDVTVVAPVFATGRRGDGATGRRGDGGTGRRGDGATGRIIEDGKTGRDGERAKKSSLALSPRRRVPPSSLLLRRQSRASCGHRGSDARFDGVGHGNLSGGDSDSADSDRARRRA